MRCAPPCASQRRRLAALRRSREPLQLQEQHAALLEGGEGGEGEGDDSASGSASDAADRVAVAAAEDALEATLPHVCGTPCSRAIALQVAVAVYLPAGFAILFPKINVLFGLLGATLGVTCMTVYPALFLLAKAAAVDAGTGYAKVDAGGDGAGADGGGEVAKADTDAPRYTPSSALWLRVHGWGILALSAVCVVLGTGVYVWSTWLAPS